MGCHYRAMTGRFVIEIRFRLNPDKRIEFDQSSEDLICCEGPGHIQTKVSEVPGHTGLVVWTSEWSDRDKLNAYLDGDRFKVLMGGLRALGTRISLQVGELTGDKPARAATQKEPIANDLAIRNRDRFTGSQKTSTETVHPSWSPP